jgi:hypothetical protein
MKKRKRKKNINRDHESVPKMFAKKYIYFYYPFFWIILIIFLLLK